MLSVLKFFIARPRVTLLLIIAAVIFGSSSLLALPQESDPEVQIPMAVVSTIYPGASPADVETLVTNKIETKLEKLENVKEITSSSLFNVSAITVEFEAHADLNKSIRDLKDKVDEAKPDLPEQAEDPVVTEITVTDRAIVTFSFGGDEIEQEQLFDLAEQIEDELDKISGVSEVILLGVRDREIVVSLEKEKIEALGLSANAILQKIKLAHVDFPIGEIAMGAENFSIRLAGKFATAQELGQLPILTGEHGTIFLRDLASVKETRTVKETTSALSVAGGKPIETVSLQIKKRTGANIIEVVDRAKAKIAQMQESGQLPEGLQMQVTNDESKFIRQDIRTLGENARSTILIVIAIIWIALGLKESFLAGISIPLVFLLTFWGMKMLDQTLNGISLFSLVLSLGLVVDNTIVITEGIFDGLKEKKLGAKDAAMFSVKTFWSPLVSGTLTTASAFVPMLMMSGIMGQYMSVIPKTVTTALLFSLFVALCFIPAIATFIFRDQDKLAAQQNAHKEWAFTTNCKRLLDRNLRLILRDRKKSSAIMGVAVLALIFSTWLVKSGAVQIEMFPAVDADYFNIELEMPNGTNLEKTSQEASKITPILQADANVENFLLAVGGGSVGRTEEGPSSGGSSQSNLATFTVNLLEKEKREKTSAQIVKGIRQKIKQIQTPGKVTVAELKGGPPSGKEIEARIFGEDLKVMENYSALVKKELEQVEGAIEIDDNISHSGGEFVFALKRQQLDFYQLDAQSVAAELRTAVFGSKAAEIARGKDELEINVEFDWNNPERKPTEIEQIANIKIPVAPGKSIPVSQVADIQLLQGFSAINHKDSQKLVKVYADIDKTSGKTAVAVLHDLQKRVEANVETPQGVAIDFGGENEDVDQSFRDLFNALIVGVILIVFILVLQFQSFIQPLIIVSTVPFSLVAVVLGFLAFSWPISLPTFVGIVSLFGIIINDAIVLIDRINENRRSGMPRESAILDAATSRLKPIFLTSLTTIFGILPLSLSDEVWWGLGFAIVFGISTSTILTMLLVPIQYSMFDDLARGFPAFFRKTFAWVKTKAKL